MDKKIEENQNHDSVPMEKLLLLSFQQENTLFF